MNFLSFFLFPKARLDVPRLLGRVWVLALARMSTHVSHAWTSLAFESVGGLDSRGSPLAMSRRIYAP